MQFNELLMTVNHLASKEEVATYFKAMHQDNIIWQGVQDFISDPASLETLIEKGGVLNTRSVCLLSIDPQIDLQQYPKSAFSSEILENLMFTYEAYLQTELESTDFAHASLLAASLVEKRKITSQWKNVILETLSRMKITSPDKFERFWKTVFAITANLAENNDELFTDLLSLQQQEMGLGIFIHSILCLSLNEDRKVDTLTIHLLNSSAQTQANALRRLRDTANPELVRSLAQRLFDRYSTIDLTEQTYGNYWSNPAASLQFALQCQSAADIALFAGDAQSSLALSNKSLEILAAVESIAKIKISAMQNDDIQGLEKQLFTEKELAQPEIAAELVFAKGSPRVDVTLHKAAHTVNVLNQSKEMLAAGNTDFANHELDTAFGALSDQEIEELLFSGARFNQPWDAIQILEGLMESRVTQEAARVARILLRRNPTDERINRLAAQVFETAGDFNSSVTIWETLTALNPDSTEIKRNLAKAYVKTHSNQDAFAVFETMISNAQKADDADLLDYAEIALVLGRTNDVLRAVDRVTETDPENSRALTLGGLASFEKGDIDLATEKLQKSIDVPSDDPRSWIALSEIYAHKGDLDNALNILKTGVAANPDQISLQTTYAKMLIQNGSVAEAYPLLRQLSSKNSNHEIDIMLLNAMKSLGIEEVGIILEEMKEKYPNDLQVRADYGQLLVENGKLSEGLAVLHEMKDEISTNADWTMAYVEAFLNYDPSVMQVARKMERRELVGADDMIENVITSQPQNVKAKILKGELLLNMHQYLDAVGLFSEILESEKNPGDKWLARLHFDLSKAAAASGKNEIALASIEAALDLQPEWIGLKQQKTETLLQSNEKVQAENMLTNTVETSPDSIEKSIWTAQILKRLGKTSDAECTLKSAIEDHPEVLELHVMAAEICSDGDNPAAAKEYLESIKNLIPSSTDTQALLNAAVVMARNGQPDEVADILTRAGELGSNDAWMNLAGFHRSLENYKACLDALEPLKGTLEGVSVLEAEVEYHAQNIDKAYEIIGASSDQIEDLEFENVFLPDVWKELVNSSNAKMALWLSMDMLTGRLEDSLTRAQNWLSADPGNSEARIYGVEVALASGANDVYAELLNIPHVEKTDMQSRHLEMLRIEREQDQGIFPLSAEEDAKEVSNPLEIDPVEISRVRALVAEGQISDSELQLENFLGKFPNLMENPYPQRLGLLRNVLKGAIATNRWKEAVNLYTNYGKAVGCNGGMKLLFLEILVQAIEFFNAAQGLNVEVHNPWSALFVASLDEEINSLAKLDESHTDQARRWVLRGNLALHPDQENVRALALIAPLAGDAAAMMAGLRATGQANTAIQIARKFENEPSVLFELAQCLCDKDANKAIEVLQRSLEIYPDQPLTLRMLSKLVESLGNRSEALENLEMAIGLWPNESRWHVQAAEILTALGNLDAPVGHLQAALELDPNNAEMLYQLGMAHIARNDPESGLECLLETAGKAPNRAEVWEAIACAHELLGNMNQALEAAEKASNTDPFAVRPHLQAGKVYWDQGEIEKALNQVKLAISLDPEDADSYVFLARLLQDKGENAKALETLERASQCQTVSARTMIEHAALLKKINGSAAARDLLAIFSQKFPENPELLKMLAEAEEECGDLRKAEAAAKRALEMHPDETNLHLFLGNIQEKTGNLDQAAHYFSQAIAHDPKDRDAYIKLSQAFSKQREFGKAREVLEEGLRRAPEDVDLYLACANLLKDAKDYRAAEQMLRKASAIDPRNLAVHRQLGAVLALNLVHQSQEVSSRL